MSFFSKVKLYIKKILIYFLIISTISSIFYTYRLYKKNQKKVEFSAIIDTDSGNGISDLFVIARALSDPGFEVIGLTSSQWNQHRGAAGSTVILSQEINDTLLKLFGREDIPHLMGAEQMIDFWDSPSLRYSDAAEFIVRKANESTKERKLNIITLGPLTNVASAIMIDSTIAPKIRVYSSVMLFDNTSKAWNKNEFNARNDLDALDLVLNTKDLELHIMPVSCSGSFELDASETDGLMNNKGARWNFLITHWAKKTISGENLSGWNLALIEAILKPDYIKKEQVNTPPENLKRQVTVYTWINKEFMKIDFRSVIKKSIPDNTR